jgi:hypothetical protein
MTTGSVGDQGWTVTNDDYELVQIASEALPQLGRVGDQLASIFGSGQRGVLADAQIALILQLVGATMSALLLSVNTKCNLDPSRGPTDIDARPRGPNNNLILRCRHNPPHCWDGSGISITCP